jgi:hypothetical protein
MYDPNANQSNQSDPMNQPGPAQDPMADFNADQDPMGLTPGQDATWDASGQSGQARDPQRDFNAGQGPMGQGGQTQDPTRAYHSLNPNQLMQVAQTFIRGLLHSNDPQAQRYANMDPSQVTPDQLTDMHQYAAQNNPQVLNDVMNHPAIANNSNLSDMASSQSDQSDQSNQQNQGW